MKPKTPIAMKTLIEEIRQIMPFEDLDANICTGQCNHCSVKLLEFLDTQIDEWEFRLKQGEIPSLKDIDELSKTSKKIYRALDKQNLID